MAVHELLLKENAHENFVLQPWFQKKLGRCVKHKKKEKKKRILSFANKLWLTKTVFTKRSLAHVVKSFIQACVSQPRPSLLVNG